MAATIEKSTLFATVPDAGPQEWEYLAVVFEDGKEMGIREHVNIRSTLDGAQQEANHLERIWGRQREIGIRVEIVILRRRVSPWEYRDGGEWWR